MDDIKLNALGSIACLLAGVASAYMDQPWWALLLGAAGWGGTVQAVNDMLAQAINDRHERLRRKP
jgi:hypothetical protein